MLVSGVPGTAMTAVLPVYLRAERQGDSDKRHLTAHSAAHQPPAAAHSGADDGVCPVHLLHAFQVSGEEAGSFSSTAIPTLPAACWTFAS